MAGHSHSANVARRKSAVDAVRAREFSKCSKAIMSAVRQSGPDPAQNIKLRYAVEKARAANMPKDTIERAIKRAAGEGAGSIEELVYEGYAPGGVALMVVCLTDNRKRTAADVKHLFDKRGGNLGSPGSVSFLFDFRSIFVVEPGDRDEEALLEVALECGAEDVEVETGAATFYAAAADFLDVKGALEARGLSFLSAETGYVPQNLVPVGDKEEAGKVLRLIGLLEENDDVQSVYANYDIPAEWIEELSGAGH
ncbi:MAG: YebC/PmpR family DNA-binding transcriptional regulator [Planctomycetota bacterium]